MKYVFGPSTDYRDLRKAAYQEYLVTTDFNVARLPVELPVNTGAAVGVAFVAALLALGISLGFDYASIEGATKGPDLLGLIRKLDRDEIPEDVREECFEGIKDAERPQKGDWLAIWGGKMPAAVSYKTYSDEIASSSTGSMALQLAKLTGFRVICVADVVKHGSRLIDLGADVLVDRQDPLRAVDIIRSVTKGRLRFALDTVGKETATQLQDSLQNSGGGKMAHLVGLTGLPEVRLPSVKYHSVPIKIFHSVPILGEATMRWLEQLLVANSLEPPKVTLADGGLEGINEALDRLRSGSVSAKRLVVPIGTKPTADSYIYAGTNGVTPKAKGNFDNLEYADKLNGDPSRIKFA